MNDRVAFPLVVDGNREAEGGVADVLLYLGIEGIVLGGGMKGYEGFHFAGETANAVERTLGQSARLLVIALTGNRFQQGFDDCLRAAADVAEATQ